MKLQSSLCLGVLVFSSFSMSAMAANKAASMTCEDFIQLDEVSRPKVVYWMDGFNRYGSTNDTFDVEQDDSLVPVLVQECTQNPKHLLSKKVKAAHKKIAAK